MRTLLEQVLNERPQWMRAALCAQADPDAFFPTKGDNARPAKRICGECEVRPACLQYALAHREPFGVWGGLSTSQRDALLREHDRRAAA